MGHNSASTVRSRRAVPLEDARERTSGSVSCRTAFIPTAPVEAERQAFFNGPRSDGLAAMKIDQDIATAVRIAA
jgi:hypothetical protein